MASLTRIFAPVGGLLHPRETLQASGVLTTLGGTLDLLCDGSATIALDVRGTFTGTLEVVGSIDGINYSSAIAIRTPSTGHIYAATVTAPSLWIGSCAGFKTLRVRWVAFTSGSATIVLQAHTDTVEVALPQAQQTATILGTAGAATTLTLTAPGAGLRHYLTSINITRYISTALTGIGTGLQVTTTNIVGNIAWSIPTETAAIGTAFIIDHDFGLPSQTTAQNTATTIVAPLNASIQWRITCGFLIAA